MESSLRFSKTPPAASPGYFLQISRSDGHEVPSLGHQTPNPIDQLSEVLEGGVLLAKRNSTHSQALFILSI